MTKISTVLLVCVALLRVTVARADEPLRQVQEELRKRNLFYGDIDGRQSSSLSAALKTYQERKGFPPTGNGDPATVRSLGIKEASDDSALPNVPVLPSDLGTAEGGDRDAVSLVAMPEPMKGPAPTHEEMRVFLRDFLTACETPVPNDDLNYYAPRVEYFHHGIVTRGYIRNQLIAYNQQWPERQYTIGEPITLKQSGGKTIVRYRLSFNLRNYEQNRSATGQTLNTCTLARRPDMSWHILAQREERVRNDARGAGRRGRRTRDPVGNTIHRVGRTMRRIFR